MFLIANAKWAVLNFHMKTTVTVTNNSEKNKDIENIMVSDLAYHLSTKWTSSTNVGPQKPKTRYSDWDLKTKATRCSGNHKHYIVAVTHKNAYANFCDSR